MIMKIIAHCKNDFYAEYNFLFLSFGFVVTFYISNNIIHALGQKFLICRIEDPKDFCCFFTN